MAALTGTALQAVETTVEGLGYEFVDAERLAAGLLRVTIDKSPAAPDKSPAAGEVEGIGLEDCERVSRQLTHLFAVEDVDYARLEVSSPGLDRPLKRARDYRRFAGSEVQVQLHMALAAAGNRKRLQGRLLEIVGAAGAETVKLQLVDEDAVQAPRRPGAGKASKTGAGRVARRTAKDVVAGAVVEFALADVDKARLVPELDFRGASRQGKKQ